MAGAAAQSWGGDKHSCWEWHGPALSLVLAPVDSGWTPDLELSIQKLQFVFGSWLIALPVECYGSMAKGTPALSHPSGFIPHPSTDPPASNSEIPKHEAKAGFASLVGASYHKLLNFTPCFGSGVSFWKLCRSCCVSDVHFAKQKDFHLVQGKAEPFQQVPRTAWPCAQSKSQQEKLIQHIRNKGYQDCQEKY